jgi:hypothetical protein
MKLCYCGRPVIEWASGWRHDDAGDKVWCYPEEAGLDEESRCNAEWSGDTLDEEEVG